MTLRRYALISLNALAAFLLFWAVEFYTPLLPDRPAISSSTPPEQPARPQEASPEAAPIATAAQEDPLRLVGIMLTQDHRSAWVRRGERALRRVTVGDELAGGRVVEISRRAIAIDLAGTRLDLLLDPPPTEAR